jgi:hypothetical protein
LDIQHEALGIRAAGDMIVAVFNPLAPWARHPPDDDAAPFSDASIYENELQDRFGERRFAPLEPGHLDVQGAELLLVAA